MSKGKVQEDPTAPEISIRTARLLLTQPEEGDQPFLDALGQDPLVRDFLGEGGLKSVEALTAEWSSHGYGILLIRLDENRSESAGLCGLVSSMMDGRREIVCAVSHQERDRGIAPEACRALLNWSEEEGLLPIHGRVSKDNDPSMKLVARIGMRRIGTRSKGSEIVFEWP